VLPQLIEAGIDCIEHGTGLTPDLVDTMVARGTALVHTVMQLENFPGYADAGEERFPRYATTMRDLYATRRETIMSAHEAGVAIYAGTDAGGVLPHGGIAGEVQALAGLGFTAEAALGAASWRARSWLGHPCLEEGAPADLVVYDRDPRTDLGVLDTPARVVLRGAVVGSR
jgi:imidazolonepropionase-like amidohydrolase